MTSPTQWAWIMSKLWETVEDREAWCLQSMGPQRVRHNLATEQQQAPRFLVVCYQTPRRLTRSLPGGARGHWPCWVNVGKGPLYQGS